MLTEEQLAWLKADNTKILLCDIVYNDGTGTKVGYFSNYSYILKSTDSFTNILGETVTNISYVDNLINIPTIVSKIDTDTTIGALEFLNGEGDYDFFITWAWEGYPLELRIGDPTWNRDQFIVILEGINSNISSPRPNVLSLSIKDKKEVFNKKVQDLYITEEYVYNLYRDYKLAHGGVIEYDAQGNEIDIVGGDPFVKQLSNEISTSIGIEARLTATTTIEEIAYLLTQLFNLEPEFGANYIELDPKTSVVNYLPGNVEDAYDGDNDPNNVVHNTGFIISNSDGGLPDVLEVTNISPVFDSALGINSATDLNNKYFHIHSMISKYYVWFNTDNGSVDPKLVEVELVDFDWQSYTVPDSNVDTPVPICIGRCFNISPVLIDSYNHVYQINEGPIQEVLEVRANGVILDGPGSEKPLYEVNLELGCIRLLVHQNNTQITCDVIGVNTRGTGYNSDFTLTQFSTAWTIEWLVLEKSSLIGTDICSFYFPIFQNTDPIGVFINTEIDLAPLLTEIMQGAGGFIRFGKTGSCPLQIIRLSDPVNETPKIYLNEDTIIEKGIQLGSTEPPKSIISLSYKRNWTVQDDGTLADIITDAAGDYLNEYTLYTSEYSTVKAENTNITDIFPLAEVSDTLPTLFYYLDHASLEAQRRIDIRNKKRYVFKLNTTAAPFTINIGDVVNLTHRRFGFAQGRNCLIVGMEEFPIRQRINLEVWL
jgi:hypothetical protein